jgi:hypothetical protein
MKVFSKQPLKKKKKELFHVGKGLEWYYRKVTCFILVSNEIIIKEKIYFVRLQVEIKYYHYDLQINEFERILWKKLDMKIYSFVILN